MWKFKTLFSPEAKFLPFCFIPKPSCMQRSLAIVFFFLPIRYKLVSHIIKRICQISFQSMTFSILLNAWVLQRSRKI